MIQLFLIAAHFLADFTMQSSDMAQRKKGDFKYLLLHAGIYACVVGAAVFAAVPFGRAVGPVLVIGASHFAIDWLRIRLDRKFPSQSVAFWSFVADQVLHVGIILLIAGAFGLGSHTSRLWQWLSGFEGFRGVLVYGAAFIALWDPACVFVKMLFFYYGDAAQQEPEAEVSNPNAGALIGKLERVIIAVLVLTDQLGSIAFVLTAKSLARHKQLEDINFAEKYLVGTLASAAIAIVTALFLKKVFL